MKYYVYIYLDLGNVPFYVGKGKDNRYHISMHSDENNTNNFLKNKIKKVGADNVKVQFLHKDLTEEQAFYLEEYYIAGIGRRDLGLGPLCNLTNGGEGESGRIVSKETGQKISKANKGKVRSKETKRRLSKSLKGRIPWNKGKILLPHSKETKCKISKATKGRKDSKETRKKKSSSHKGKKFSMEHKRKISKANKGRECTKATKQKMRKAKEGKMSGKENPMYGKHHTEETKRKISETKRKKRKGD